MPAPKLERYEIREELGQGGMSVVYRARDTQLGRDVAVKVLHDFLARQTDARQRFHREAVAVAQLRHPGILEIFDYSGPDAPSAFIVTELIDGVTLRAFVERIGRLPHPEMGALVALELSRALSHAHERGIIHRDLKPENAMVTRQGRLKLMDFGIAQLRDGPRVTVTGTLLGSPAHMAPEIIDGHRPDHRADLFSLGTILYWLTTGALPFDAPNPSALFKRILAGEYEHPQMLEPKIGNGLARIIERALATDPEARFSSAAELVAALEEDLEAAGVATDAGELARLLADPDGYGRALAPRLVEGLTAAGREALEASQVARATDCFNRVLAIEPEHAEVKALAASVGRRADAQRRRRAVITGLGASAAGLLVAAAVWLAVRPGAEPTTARADVAPPGTELAHAAPGTPTSSTGTDLAGAAPEAAARIEIAAAPALPRAERPALAPEVSPTAAERLEARLAGAGRGRPALRADVTTVLDGRSRPPLARARPGVGAPVAGLRPETRPTLPSVAAAPADAGVAPSDAGAPSTRAPAPLVAPLRVRIGGSFADLYLDGRRVRRDVFNAQLELGVGRHELRVVKPGHGAFRSRILEVRPDGSIIELREGGPGRAVLGEMKFPIPRPGGPEVSGWEPADGAPIAP